MLPTGTVNELLGDVKLITFDLSEINGFPVAEYNSRKTIYDELAAWYSGAKLDVKQTQGGRTVEKYPIKINPIRGAVYKHAYALFGEVHDDSRPLAPPVLRPADRTQKDIAQLGQNFLNALWFENHGRTLMLRNGLISQVYGGCVFQTSYIPKGQKWRKYPIRIQDVHPANFVGLPMSGDEYRLEEAWVVKATTAKEAMKAYNMPFSEDELVYYVEYWNPEEYNITLNGQPIPTGEFDNKGKPLYYNGKNPFDAVPIVYIPHIRTNTFWGDSLISDNVTGIVEELNKRVADYGDAVSDDSHKYYVVTNTSGKPDVYELAPGIRVIQLPSSPNITGKESDPNMDELGRSSASQAMRDLNEQLYEHFRREAFIPAVADGEDEGSQRSALTLAMRMWPLLSHTAMERVYWGDGLAYLDQLILKVATAQNIGDVAQHEKQINDMRIERRWAPVLPRDREAFINELVNRASANLGSLEHLLSLIDDIEDPEGEVEEIKKFLREVAKIEAEAQPKPEPQKTSGAGAEKKSQDKE